MILLSSAQITSTLHSNLLEVNNDVNLDIDTDDPEVKECLSTEDEDEEADEIVPIGTTSKDTRSAAVFKGKNDRLVELPLAKELYVMWNKKTNLT